MDAVSLTKQVEQELSKLKKTETGLDRNERLFSLINQVNERWYRADSLFREEALELAERVQTLVLSEELKKELSAALPKSDDFFFLALPPLVLHLATPPHYPSLMALRTTSKRISAFVDRVLSSVKRFDTPTAIKTTKIAGFATFLAGHLPGLEKLILKDKFVDENTLSIILNGCTKLVSLDLSNKIYQHFDKSLYPTFMCLTEGVYSLTELDLSFLPIDKRSIERLVRGFPSLTALKLECCTVISDDLRMLSEGFSGLRELSLAENERIDSESLTHLVSNCSQLTRLSLRDNLYCTDQGMIAIGEGCSDLTALDLMYCRHPTTEGVIAFTKKCSRLASLNVNAFGCVRRGLPLSSEVIYEYLTSLNLSYCQDVTDESLAALGQMAPSLKSLAISDCNQLTHLGLSWLVNGCSGLTALDISSCEKVDNRGVSSLARLPRLKALMIDQLFDRWTSIHTNITCETLKLISDSCTELVCLSIKNCQIVPESIGAFVNNCPSLSAFRFAGINFNAEFFADGFDLDNSAKKLSVLTHLEIEEIQVTDADLEKLSKRCPKLSCLVISKGHMVSDLGIKALAKSCPELTLFQCRYSKIGDLGIEALARGCPGLTALDVKSCAITDGGLKALSEHSPLLVSLGVYDCQKISFDGLKALFAGCHSLAALTLSIAGQVEWEKINSVKHPFTVILSGNYDNPFVYMQNNSRRFGSQYFS